MNTQPNLEFLNGNNEKEVTQFVRFAIPNEPRYLGPIEKTIENAHKTKTCEVKLFKKTKTKIIYAVRINKPYQVTQVLFSMGVNFGYHVKADNVARLD